MRDRHSQIARLLAATDTGFTNRAALEFAVVVTVVMLLTAIAARSFEKNIIRSRITEAFSLTSTIKIDLAVYRAAHGRWPATADALANSTAQRQQDLGQFVDRIKLLPDGAFSVYFNNASGTIAGTRLSFRPGRRSSRSSPMTWRCDSRELPASGAAAPERHPVTAAEFVPVGCREH